MERLSKKRLEYLLAIMEKNSIEYSVVNDSYEIRLIPEIQQACKQIRELILCEDMVQQYRDEKEAEQAEIELCYIDIILDLYEQLEAKCLDLKKTK